METEPEAQVDPEAEEDAIDENDPIWKACLVVTNNNREEALKMLEDPDSLMQYPEIRKIMEAAPVGDDDWESEQSKASVSASVAAIETAVEKVVLDAPASPVPADEAPAEDADVVLQDSDPRPHLNLVFIGHVDAGKVSGRDSFSDFPDD